MENHPNRPILVVAAVCRHNGRVLILRRKEGLSHAGLWELPGGKVEPGEALQEALKREIKEELGLDCEVGSVVGVGHSQSETGSINLIGLDCVLDGPPVKSTDHDQIRWIEHSQVAELPLGIADLEILAQVLRPEVEVSGIGVGSAVRIAFAAHAVLGLLLAAFVFGFQKMLPPEYNQITKAGNLAYVILPVMYGIVGVVVGFVAATAYNVIAKLIGGLRLRL